MAWEPNSASATPMVVNAVGKGKGKNASCWDVPATQRKTASSIKVRARARAKERQRVPLTGTAPPSSRVSVATVARKATNGQSARSVKKDHAVDGAPSTATVAAVEDTKEMDEAGICESWSDDDDSRVDNSEAWVLSVEGNNMPVDAKFLPFNTEFLPFNSAFEEHICPWNSAQGGRDLCPSNVQLRNANWSLNSFRQESDGVI